MGFQDSAFSSGPKETELKTVDENCMVSRYGVVKMYYFAIDFRAKMPYPLTPPQGWEVVLIFDN